MKKNNNITAVILAGGNLHNSELPLFTEFSGETLFDYLAVQIIKTGVREIVICASDADVEVISQRFGDKYRDADIIYSREYEPCGTGGALVCAQRLFSNDELLVLNGDAYIACDISRFVEWFHGLSEADAGILLANVDNTENLGRVLFYDDNQIYKFEEKNKYSGPGLVSAGIYMLNKTLLKRMPETIPYSLETGLFPELVRERKMYGLPTIGTFVDVKSPNAEWFIRNHHQKRLLPRL
ncbi:MAG: sugar phosphate nucleotidyltransferase [Victivallaceae bacterium]|nr:sugar phosphate nucleotidyltransferase [Victivallaceae bacterium]MDD3116540.1 sugar phosphate nucleotidyltransferase [Victivallaceae bacterium]MDD3703020.1 sugar phosphate nucleotidyltransferase [Victivallaceae bacterium]MDD4316888.1 sugar phosphate nucleotidyltransferase [Victivallaceae bacterium]MDD5662724.1 sugar phosphate nucleotidyltransferase [Victivallaceae bacterium]